jgi:hypothetical protein
VQRSQSLSAPLSTPWHCSVCLICAVRCCTAWHGPSHFSGQLQARRACQRPRAACSNFIVLETDRKRQVSNIHASGNVYLEIRCIATWSTPVWRYNGVERPAAAGAVARSIPITPELARWLCRLTRGTLPQPHSVKQRAGCTRRALPLSTNTFGFGERLRFAASILRWKHTWPVCGQSLRNTEQGLHVAHWHGFVL